MRAPACKWLSPPDSSHVFRCDLRALQGARLEGDAVVLSADAVVIGSGAGGGVTAALLVEAGAKVWTTYFEKQ